MIPECICKQEPTISKIERKLNNIDLKLDRFLVKTTRIETIIGILKAIFIVIIAPVLVGFLIYISTK